jgi:hypothetical protein
MIQSPGSKTLFVWNWARLKAIRAAADADHAGEHADADAGGRASKKG